MLKIRIFFLYVFIIVTSNGYSQIIKPNKYSDTIKIACIGNSITYGYNIKDREEDSYPARLEKLLGVGYKVNNYGISARTLLSKGDLPYIKEQAFKDALNFQPDVVIIMLGTNDTKPRNWIYKDDFIKDYSNLITAFDTLASKPKIVLCQVVPAFPDRWGINDSTITAELNPMIQEVARMHRLPCIDLHSPFVNKAKLFPDRIHPNEEGADLMARILLEALIVKKKKRQYMMSSYGNNK